MKPSHFERVLRKELEGVCRRLSSQMPPDYAFLVLVRLNEHEVAHWGITAGMSLEELQTAMRLLMTATDGKDGAP